jgi:hypothetical protein
MARKKAEVFGVAFLDLLSGALGAVILLFVVVPRMPISYEELERQMNLNDELNKLGLSLERLRESVPDEEYDSLQIVIDHAISMVEKVEEEKNKLEHEISEAENENNILNSEIEQIKGSIEDAQLGKENCNEDFERIEGERRFILINMDWSTDKHDVDLHVKAPWGDEFYYKKPSFNGRPGKLTLDNENGPGLEVWTISDPPPGRYKVMVNLYDKHGNFEKPKVRLRIYHRNGMKKIGSINLIREKDKMVVCEIEVSVTGEINIL